jgi:hypothetical protein
MGHAGVPIPECLFFHFMFRVLSFLFVEGRSVRSAVPVHEQSHTGRGYSAWPTGTMRNGVAVAT